ncbi:response regulator [Marinobacter hydrocarbonoclasticus]|uniref:ATP-binding protein n=1 Tax=Marinobacter nauticus TaxID=2743 RepID=UPI001C975326|nr:ATP-binding protein [Marinobacter nauticus]MBY6194600.1 response regulator [Marinobacter nauticus]MBY6215748.1 response regulator [Marinobacter nauticus]
MIEAVKPRNEEQRLQALSCIGLLDSATEQRFDHIVAKALKLFDVPIALITLLDSQRQWFKAKSGLKEKETPRNISFCSHTLSNDKPLIVEDTLQDERFQDNPLVLGELNIRFYAGYPIHSPDGYTLGTICILDHKPRSFGDQELKLLRHLAELVDKEIADTPSVDSTLAEDSKKGFGRFLPKLVFFISRRATALSIALLIFFALFATSSRYYLKALESDHLKRQTEISDRLFNIRGRLETELNARLHLTHGLAGLVRASSDNINRGSFLAFANNLGASLSGIRSLQLAPDGVVQFLWPEATKSPALGHDLLADPNRKAIAEKAIATGDMWIAGPLELIQGGTALIGRLPVFLPHKVSASRSGTGPFWGFATVLIDLDSLLNTIHFHRLSENYNVAIRGLNGLGPNGDIFVGSPKVFDGNHLAASVSLPAGSWQIGITVPPPPSLSTISVANWVLLVSVSLVISALLYLLLRLPSRYLRAVSQAKRALAKTNARFRDAIEALPEGFAIFDEVDRLVNCNQKYRDFFAQENRPISLGISFEDMFRESINAGLYELPDDRSGGYDQFFADRLSHHRDPSPEGLELKLANQRWLRAVESRIPSGGTVIAYSDVTELKKKEHELAAEKLRAESANEGKTAFLATVSHELRTPLNAILGMLNLLQLSGRLGPKDQEYIDLTHDSAEHLLHLLNELLDLSKMEANKLVFEQSAFNVARVARKTLKLCQSKAEQANITLIEHIDPECEVLALGDVGRLQQILLNLLSNGIKFTDEGSVTLTVTREKPTGKGYQFRFRVEDTGIGFSDSQAATLFQPFMQLDSTASRKHEGTGLGLAICKRLTEFMGGEISAKGKPGAGATFEFTIPFETSGPEIPNESNDDSQEEPDSDLPDKPVRVLIAEDSPANQIVFKAMLENTGYYADIVGNGVEAVRAAKDFDYDIILMDIFMPEMDGIEATQLIRRSFATKNTPIIALTANAMPGDQDRFLEAGMDDYLAKPLNKSTLVKMLRKYSC